MERALKDHLEKLEAADFTFLEALEPDPTYIFKHIITQEAAYQTLLYAQRRQLHRTVAEWYEETFGNEGLLPYYPLLVHHYHHAEVQDKERHYAQRAGEQAAAQFADAEAIRFFSRALELTPKSNAAERFGLLLAREKVYDVLAARDDQEADLAALVAVAAHLPVDRQARVALRSPDMPGQLATFQRLSSLLSRQSPRSRRSMSVWRPKDKSPWVSR